MTEPRTDRHPGRIVAFVFAGLFAAWGFAIVVGQTASEVVCVNYPYLVYLKTQPALAIFDPNVSLKPGTTSHINAALVACADHPTLRQHVLDLLSLTYLPVAVCAAILLMRLAVLVDRAGPFTTQVMRLLYITGWFVLVAGLAVGSVEGFAQHALLHSILSVPGDLGGVPFLPPSMLASAVPAAVACALFCGWRLVRAGIRREAALSAAAQ